MWPALVPIELSAIALVGQVRITQLLIFQQEFGNQSLKT
jgi:hypothetical protein